MAGELGVCRKRQPAGLVVVQWSILITWCLCKVALTIKLHGATCIHPEKAMAPHSSTLAWKIPWTEEPGRLQSMGSLRVGHD